MTDEKSGLSRRLLSLRLQQSLLVNPGGLLGCDDCSCPIQPLRAPNRATILGHLLRSEDQL